MKHSPVISQRGASAIAIALVGLGILVLVVGGIFFLRFVGRALGLNTPRVQQVAAAEPKQEIQLISTETKLIVEELPPGEDRGIRVSDVLANPTELAGSKVTVHGYIYRNIDSWGFEMTETLDDHKELVVIALPQFITENQLSEPYLKGTPVKVEGTVKYFTRDEEGNKYLGLEKLEDPLFGSIFGRHVIVAEKIQKIE